MGNVKFKINLFDGQCVIQLNLSKNRKIKRLSFDGNTKSGPIHLDHFILDDNGQLYDTPDVNSEKIFIKGEVGSSNGVISVKIESFDGSTQYLNTFCSNKT